MIKNYIYNMLYHVFSLLTPLIITPYITRVIDQSLIGVNALLNSKVSFLCILGTLGMETLGVRTIAKAREDSNADFNKTFYKLFYIQFSLHLLIFTGYLCFCIFSKSTSKLQYVYLLFILSSMFNVGWFFQGVEDFRYISIRNIAVRILSTLAILIFVNKSDDIDIYVLCLYVPQLLLNLLMLATIRRRYKIKVAKYSFDTTYFKSALVLAVPAVSISIYTIIDRVVLGLFGSAVDVAIYEQGQSLIKIILSVVSAWSVAVFPRVSNVLSKKDEGGFLDILKKSSSFIFFISFALFWGALAVNKLFITWYLPESYAEVVDVIYICAPMILIVSFEQIFGMQVLLPFGMDKKYTITLICAACVNCVLDFITIPFWGIKAACVCSVIAEFVAMFLQIWFCRKIINVKEILKGCVLFFFSGLLMFVVIKILITCLPQHFGFYILACILGAGLYLTLTAKKIKASIF